MKIKEMTAMYEKLGLQVYSVRNHINSPEETAETFKKLAEMGYTEIQTAGSFANCPPEAYAKAAKDAGLTVIGTHYQVPEDVDDIDDYVAMHRLLGTTNAGIGGLRLETIGEYEAFVEKANRLAKNLARHGMKFTYHHHSWEFARLDGVRPIDLLLEKLDKDNITFVFDTYWLNNAGVDVVSFLEKYGDRCEILHLKDRAVKPATNEAYITELGSGNLDWAAILEVAERKGIKHICVEQDIWPEDGDSLISCAMSAEYFKKTFLGK